MDESVEQTDPRIARLVSAVAHLDRIVILGVLARSELTTEELSAVTALEPSAVGQHLAILGRARLISTRKDGQRRLLSLRREAITELEAWSCNALSTSSTEDGPGEDIPAEVRQFFVGRRLESFPARQSRKAKVLGVIVLDFERNRAYAEAEVNKILVQRYPDFSTLRRALIDEGLMTRSGGVYRRAD